MRRRLIASIWIAGATVPLLAGTILIVGCCALPFHQVIHRVMPLCEAAMRVMSGDTDDGQGERPSAPAREKQEPVPRIVTIVPSSCRFAGSTATPLIPSTRSGTGYRSFIALGALRCDHDVGLHVLDETFLI